ncbi:membrane-targeted effector domain-containing toxin [Pseudomonas canadensis]|nr:membrane-targeted effector domain-containing toxin [Pseudomonas canadensis]
MPPSPRTRHGERYNPISRPARPKQPDTRPRVPLPSDEYATSASTNGALIPDHFAADRLPFTREKFTLEMNGFYKDMAAGGMPPRPVIPDITASTRPNEMIADALTKTDVLVFGENHSEVASLVLMRDAMKTFKDSGVNAIYLEGATLDAYGLIADATLAKNIKNRAGGSTIYDELKKAADEFDIELMPLEHRYLTRHSDNPGYFSPLDTQPKSSTAFKALSKQRLEEMNYYGARQVMKNELGGKSVVWVGRAHMNTSEGVPGIAELTGGIGISVYQNAAIPQSAVRKANVPIVPSSTLSGSDMSAGDLQIDVKV